MRRRRPKPVFLFVLAFASQPQGTMQCGSAGDSNEPRLSAAAGALGGERRGECGGLRPDEPLSDTRRTGRQLRDRRALRAAAGAGAELGFARARDERIAAAARSDAVGYRRRTAARLAGRSRRSGAARRRGRSWSAGSGGQYQRPGPGGSQRSAGHRRA